MPAQAARPQMQDSHLEPEIFDTQKAQGASLRGHGTIMTQKAPGATLWGHNKICDANNTGAVLLGLFFGVTAKLWHKKHLG
eukprot:1156329-Pelagomonas_calceolata.AAC.1